MAEPALAQELDPVEFARRLEAIPGAQSGTLPAPAPTPEEPPAWGEIKESEEYKSLTFPEGRGDQGVCGHASRLY